MSVAAAVPSPVASLHATERPRPGFQFTERMRGFVQVTGPDGHPARAGRAVYTAARDAGEADGVDLELTLTVVCENLQALRADPRHEASAIGTARCPRLWGDEPLTFTRGRFRLFVVDPERVERRTIEYEGLLTSADGESYYLVGHKALANERGLDVWEDSSTLFVTIYRGDRTDPDSLYARGILRLAFGDFVQQLLTIRARHAPSLAERVDTVVEFTRFFAGALLDLYGRIFARSSIVTHDVGPEPRPPARGGYVRPEAQPHVITVSDNVRVQLTRYRPPAARPKGPVILSPGFGMTSRAFVLDTVPVNLVDYLCAEDYDVWLLDYRSSPRLVAAGTPFAIDDIALRDYPGAVRKVLDETGAKKVQMVVHCVGSMALLMSLAAGRLEGQVRSVICSQLGLHPITEPWNELKSGTPLATVLRWLGFRTLDARFDERSGWDWAIDKCLRLVRTRERCNNPVCRRVLFLFGESYRHDRLNTRTHDAMRELFGTTSLRALQHLSRMLRSRRAVDEDGDNVYLPHLDRLALPISFLHGSENRQFLPESTEKTYHLLCRKNGTCFYSYKSVPGFGHLDCFVGRGADKEVFPWILGELEKYPRP